MVHFFSIRPIKQNITPKTQTYQMLSVEVTQMYRAILVTRIFCYRYSTITNSAKNNILNKIWWSLQQLADYWMKFLSTVIQVWHFYRTMTS